MRERWQLAAYQQLSPGWQQQLAFTLTVTTSYEGAAALLRQLEHPADNTTLHALAQTLGGRAEAQTQERMKQPVQEQTPERAASAVGVLMLDGWMVRQRGPGWGKQKTTQPRVAWHELKTSVFYLQEQAVQKNGRGLLTDKAVVSWQGEPLELGQRLHQAACEHGLDLECGARPLARPGGVGLPATARSQTQRPILDALGLASSVRLDRSTPKRSLGSPMHSLTGGTCQMYPGVVSGQFGIAGGFSIDNVLRPIRISRHNHERDKRHQ